MVCGAGLTLSAQLSEARALLAATNLKCNDGNEYALAFGGQINNSDYVKTVDIYKNDESLTRTNDGLEGLGRDRLAATTIRCPDGNEYALFGGGLSGSDFSNDVDVFACNADGVYHEKLTQFTGPGRRRLAATTIRCPDGKEYALFAGGFYNDDEPSAGVFSNDVDVFACNADGVYHEKHTQFTGPARSSLAATTIRCNDGNEYALFAGGVYRNDGKFVYSNDVDVFACNADGVYQKEHTQFTGTARGVLTATTIRCNDGNEYALLAGGVYANDRNPYFIAPSNDVDVFACNADGVYQKELTQFTRPGRSHLAATTITCADGKQYALFGGGLDDDFISLNDVDVFACNADGVYQKEHTQFTGPGREGLAATTITIDCKQYALFMGGETASGEYTDAIDIYDCETGEFLPQPSS